MPNTTTFHFQLFNRPLPLHTTSTQELWFFIHQQNRIINESFLQESYFKLLSQIDVIRISEEEQMEIHENQAQFAMEFSSAAPHFSDIEILNHIIFLVEPSSNEPNQVHQKSTLTQLGNQ